MNDLVMSELQPVGMKELVGPIIVYLVSVIALWKFFTKMGEKGWKAIIPLYNIYTIAKIVGEKERGKKIVIFTILIPITSFILGFIAGYAEVHPTNWSQIVTILFSIVAVYCVIKVFVEYIKTFVSLNKKLKISSAWMVAWLLAPIVGHIYLGFFWKNEEKNK